MAPPIIYDPRHTTGVTPVHKNVKHPLAYDPRRPGARRPLHIGRGPSLRALFVWLAILLVALVLGLAFLISAAADRSAG